VAKLVAMVCGSTNLVKGRSSFSVLRAFYTAFEELAHDGRRKKALTMVLLDIKGHLAGRVSVGASRDHALVWKPSSTISTGRWLC
jgi:hypothetical protein